MTRYLQSEQEQSSGRRIGPKRVPGVTSITTGFSSISATCPIWTFCTITERARSPYSYVQKVRYIFVDPFGCFLMFSNRLSLFSSLFSLTWFLTAHILIYTSLKTCRFSSPHIWWLVFGILCITYLMILEVILLSLVVFVFAPGTFIYFDQM